MIERLSRRLGRPDCPCPTARTRLLPMWAAPVRIQHGRDPLLVPIPTETAGVSPHVTDLAGVWKFSLLPPPEFWSNRVDPAGWADVTVPGELTAQGHPIARDSEYAVQAVDSYSRGREG